MAHGMLYFLVPKNRSRMLCRTYKHSEFYFFYTKNVKTLTLILELNIGPDSSRCSTPSFYGRSETSLTRYDASSLFYPFQPFSSGLLALSSLLNKAAVTLYPISFSNTRTHAPTHNYSSTVLLLLSESHASQ